MISMNWEQAYKLFSERDFEIKTSVKPGSVHIHSVVDKFKRFCIQGILLSEFHFKNGLTISKTQTFSYKLSPTGDIQHYRLVGSPIFDVLTEFCISGPERKNNICYTKQIPLHPRNNIYDFPFENLILLISCTGFGAVQDDIYEYNEFGDILKSYTPDYWEVSNDYSVAIRSPIPKMVLVTEIVQQINTRPETLKKSIGFGDSGFEPKATSITKQLLFSTTGEIFVGNKYPNFNLFYKKSFEGVTDPCNYEKFIKYTESESDSPWLFHDTVVWRYVDEDEIDILYNGANLSIDEQYKQSSVLVSELTKYVPVRISAHKFDFLKKFKITDTSHSIESSMIAKSYEQRYGQGKDKDQLQDRNTARKILNKMLRDSIKE